MLRERRKGHTVSSEISKNVYSVWSVRMNKNLKKDYKEIRKPFVSTTNFFL